MREGWEIKKLSHVCEIGDGNHSSKYPKSSEMVSQGIPFIRSNNLVNGEVSWNDMKFITKEKHAILKKGHLKPGDVLFTNRGEIGKIAIVGQDFENANLNSQIAWFRCKHNLVNQYLYYYLLSPAMKNHYLIEKNGAALQQFTIRLINNIEINIPPLPEQQRIVAILDEAFAAIDKAKANAEKNLKNAKELFESYLHRVFENGRNNWEITSLSKLFDVKSSRRVHQKDWKESGVPFYRAREVVKLARDGQVNNELFISQELFDEFIKNTGAPKPGDIIISAVGTLGQCYIVKEIDRFYFKDASVLWFENLGLVNARFIYFAFKTNLIMSQVMDGSMGATVGTLTISRAREIKIPVPPLSEQTKLVKEFDYFSAETKRLESIYQQKLTDLEELKKSILQKAFNGELNNAV